MRIHIGDLFLLGKGVETIKHSVGDLFLKGGISNRNLFLNTPNSGQLIPRYRADTTIIRADTTLISADYWV